jgi:hypothetical protein
VIDRATSPMIASPHGFLGRTGGASVGLYASLNVGLGSADDPVAVRENRRRAAHAIAPAAHLLTLHQVHSAVCVEAGDWDENHRPEADALVTDRPGLLLGILTADCAPVLLEDRNAGVIGAAHAGWKGALGGIVDATVAAMERRGAARARIAAAIGPTIGPASYEVGPEFRARFLAGAPESARFFANGPAGRPHFDLPAFVAHRLEAAGVGRVTNLALDTRALEDRYFSYRRSTLEGAPDYGRQLSAIVRA